MLVINLFCIVTDNETALYLSDEVAIQLTATNNNNIPTDYSTPVSVAYVTEVAETTTKITLMVTVQPGSDTSKESDDITTTTASPKRTGKSRSFPIAPHYHLPDSRWGPFFEEGSETQNVTTRVGSTILLDCRIGLLQDKMVSRASVLDYIKLKISTIFKKSVFVDFTIYHHFKLICFHY